MVHPLNAFAPAFRRKEEGGSEIAAPMVRLRRTMSLVQRPALYYIGPFGPRRNSFLNTCMLDSQALIYVPCSRAVVTALRSHKPF